jgi:hypothetical protein
MAQVVKHLLSKCNAKRERRKRKNGMRDLISLEIIFFHIFLYKLDFALFLVHCNVLLINNLAFSSAYYSIQPLDILIISVLILLSMFKIFSSPPGL